MFVRFVNKKLGIDVLINPGMVVSVYTNKEMIGCEMSLTNGQVISLPDFSVEEVLKALRLEFITESEHRHCVEKDNKLEETHRSEWYSEQSDDAVVVDCPLPDKRGVPLPLKDQSVTLSLREETITLSCDSRRDAETIFDWLESLVGE